MRITEQEIWDLYQQQSSFSPVEFAKSILQFEEKRLGHLTATKDANGVIVAVTRTDDEHQVLEVLFEGNSAPQSKAVQLAAPDEVAVNSLAIDESSRLFPREPIPASFVEKTKPEVTSKSELATTIEVSNSEGNETPATGYLYASIEEYEQILGYKVNFATRTGWDMARLRWENI